MLTTLGVFDACGTKGAERCVVTRVRDAAILLVESFLSSCFRFKKKVIGDCDNGGSSGDQIPWRNATSACPMGDDRGLEEFRCREGKEVRVVFIASDATRICCEK